MKVTTERTPDCNAVITVEVDEDQIARAMRTVAQKVSRARPIPGFRPGKAPYERVERAVGKNVLRDEAIEDLAKSLYQQVLVDEKIDLYDAGSLDIPQKEPLILKFTVPTRPVVTLGDYRAVHAQPKPVDVTDDEVTQVIARFQNEQAELVPVTRPIQLDDLVTADLNGGPEGEEATERTGLQLRIKAEIGAFPWIEQLVGANANEPKTITYTYPADDPATNFAGKTVNYTVTITDVKESKLPELNDEFAKSISALETMDALKSTVRANLLAQKQTEENNRFADEIVDTVVDQAQIAFPTLMVDDEVNHELARSKDIAQQLSLTWDKYLELSGKTEAEFRETVRPRAERRIKRLLTLMELAEAEKITVSAKDVDVEIDYRAMQAAQNGERADQTRRALSTKESRRDIEFSVRMGKAIDHVVAMAKGEPTSGLIVTPESLRAEEQARAQAANAAAPAPISLITDPAQVTGENLPSSLGRVLVPGQDQ